MLLWVGDETPSEGTEKAKMVRYYSTKHGIYFIETSDWSVSKRWVLYKMPGVEIGRYATEEEAEKKIESLNENKTPLGA